MGQVANLMLSLLALPTSRNNIWSKMCGVSWEAMQQYHAGLGYLFIISVTLHQFLWWGTYKYQEDNVPSSFKSSGQFAAWPGDILSIPMQYHVDNYTTPLIVLVWVLMIVMGVCANYLIRRANFELFYYTHFFFLVIYGAALLHASSLWPTFIVGLSLWVTDRLIRFTRGCQVAHVSVFETYNELTILEIDTLDGQPCSFLEGQYAFLNVPALSTLQWHPFTISSSPHQGVLRFCIKKMGQDGADTWTKQLHDLASQSRGNGVLVNYDGPYGIPPALDCAGTLSLVLGGIGVTPGLSILGESYHTLETGGAHLAPHVHFTWVVQKFSNVTPWAVELLNKAHSHAKVTVAVYFSRETKDAVIPAHFEFAATTGSRPDMDLHFMHALGDSAGKHTVFACGLAAMVEDAEKLAFKHGMAFHKETFEL